MIFSVTRNQVDYDPEDEREPKIWPRAEFPLPWLIEGIRSLSLEEERDESNTLIRKLYHIVKESDLATVLDFADVEDDIRLSNIHAALGGIEVEAYPVPTAQEILDATRLIKINEIQIRRNSHIASIMGIDVGNMGMLKVVYLNTDPTFHTQDMIDSYEVWQYAAGKITLAKTATQVQLDAYDVNNDSNWPV